jgi:NitT/TauT family transport system substrate-binding protein
MTRVAVLLTCLSLAGCKTDTTTAPEQKNVAVAVPGSTNVAFLALLAAKQLGYFQDEGITVDIKDVASGTAARQLVIDGQAQAAIGFYELAIQAQAQGIDLVAVALAADRPGLVLAVRKDLAGSITKVADLKGRRVGIAAVGSGTHNLLRYLLLKAGVQESDVTIVTIGNGATAISAVQSKNVDALVGLDPAITTLLLANQITLLVDTRSANATTATYGGDYPATSLYTLRAFAARNPATTRALVKGIVRATEWLRTTPPLEIPVKLNFGTDPASRELWVQILNDSKEMFAESGRFTPEDTKRVFDAVSLFDSQVAASKIDLSRTYTNWFVDAVR